MAVWSSSSVFSKNTGLNLLIQVALVFSTFQTSFALFSQTTRWYDVSVQRNSQGTWCYLPSANAVRDVACKGAASNFASVMDVHLNQGLSIAYYNGIDNVLLGGANYSLPAGPSMPVIRLCVSGRAGDGYYYETICVNAVADNQLGNNPSCQVALGQKEVTDGCYEPNAVRTVSRSSGAATCTGAISSCTAGVSTVTVSYGGSPYSSKSGIPAKFRITPSCAFVAVIMVRTLLWL